MSNPNGHLSASQRRIRDLEQQVAILQQNAREFEAFMNYVIENYGTETAFPEDGKYFAIYADSLKKLEPFRTVRTEIRTEVDHPGRKYMRLTLASRIILKG